MNFYGSYNPWPWQTNDIDYLGFLMVPIDEMTVVVFPDALVDIEMTGGLTDVVVITLGFEPETLLGWASHFDFLFNRSPE